MGKVKLILGKNCKYCKEGGIWVSSEGNFVAYNTDGNYEQLNIEVDAIGKYVAHPTRGRVSVPKAVLKCYCPPAPVDKIYMVGYKDGDKNNCDCTNLLWVPYKYRHTTTDSVFLYLGSIKIKVCKDGSLWDEQGQQIIPCDSAGDYDTDTMYVKNDPCIGYPRRNSIFRGTVTVDSIMDMAGYVQGDDSVLKKPFILHKDNDWKNFASSNLEWVEKDDKRVASYLGKKQLDREQRWYELNPTFNSQQKPPYTI